MFFRLLVLFCTLVAATAFARDPLPDIPHFVRGADVSGVTEMEERGRSFVSDVGIRTDIFRLLADYGVRAVRLQVCVNPEGRWHGMEDVLSKALRARRAGMDVMLAFLYADGKDGEAARTMPAAWRNLDADSLVQAVSNHTAQVLQRFKDDGVRPRWVQVGGPAAGGFLLPFGRIEANPEGFARCFEAGARAVKSVFPRTAVVVHFGPGTERTAMDRTLEVLRENCVRWDIVSWSSFPAPDEDRETADGRVSALLEELRRIAYEWSTDTLIGEIGFSCKAGEYELNRRRLAYLLDNAVKLRRCRGLFYYEPEVRPKDSTQPLGAFDDFGHPTPIMEGFR